MREWDKFMAVSALRRRERRRRYIQKMLAGVFVIILIEAAVMIFILK